MIKINNMAKWFVLVVCALLYNPSSAFSVDISTEVVVTDDNGSTTEQIDGFYTPSGSSSSSGSTSPGINIPGLGGSDDSGTGDGTGGTGENAENVCGKDNEKCSNLYHGRPLFPETMMIYCQINAEDIAKDYSLIEECIKKYVKVLNNDNGGIKRDGMQDYNVLRTQALRDVLAIATDKLKATIDYNNVQNDFANAIARSNTQRDTEASLAHAHAFSTDMINNLRELYAENLKYMAIDGIANIDPAAILNKEEYEESKTTVRKSAETETENKSISATSNATDDSKDGSSEDTSDWGSHDWSLDELGGEESSDNGEGSNYVGEDSLDIPDEGSYDFPEVTVEGHSKISDFENMSPEELAQHQQEIAELRKALEETLNDPDASDSEIAGAQKALERLAALEQSIRQ